MRKAQTGRLIDKDKWSMRLWEQFVPYKCNLLIDLSFSVYFKAQKEIIKTTHVKICIHSLNKWSNNKFCKSWNGNQMRFLKFSNKTSLFCSIVSPDICVANLLFIICLAELSTIYLCQVIHSGKLNFMP